MNSTSTPAVTLTIYELWIQLLVLYGTIGGILPTVFAALIWAGIWREKKLRSRFYAIVGCLTFVRMLYAIAFILMALFRSLRTAGVVETNQTRLICHSIHILLVNNQTAELTLLCTLVIDRAVAVTLVTYYRLLSTKSAFQLCVAQYVLVSIVKLVPSYFGNNLLEMVQCVSFASALNETYNQFNTGIDLFLVFAVLVIYLLLIAFIRLRISAIQQAANNMALQRQLKLMPVLRNLVLMHVSLTLVGKSLTYLGNNNYFPEHSQRLTAAGGSMSAVDVFANVMILLITNQAIRDAALPAFMKKKKNQVGSVPASQPAVLVTKW